MITCVGYNLYAFTRLEQSDSVSEAGITGASVDQLSTSDTGAGAVAEQRAGNSGRRGWRD